MPAGRGWAVSLPRWACPSELSFPGQAPVSKRSRGGPQGGRAQPRLCIPGRPAAAGLCPSERLPGWALPGHSKGATPGLSGRGGPTVSSGGQRGPTVGAPCAALAPCPPRMGRGWSPGPGGSPVMDRRVGRAREHGVSVAPVGAEGASARSEGAGGWRGGNAVPGARPGAFALWGYGFRVSGGRCVITSTPNTCGQSGRPPSPRGAPSSVLSYATSAGPGVLEPRGHSTFRGHPRKAR